MNAIRNIWVRAALVASLLVPVYFLVASLGTRFGLIDWRLGFGLMTFRLGANVIMGAAAFAALGLLLALLVPPRTGWKTALVALLIPLAGLGYGQYVRSSVGAAPPIHDVTTDLADPPSFSQSVVDARARIKCGNGLKFHDARIFETSDPDCAFAPPGDLVIDLHRAAYADIQPVRLGMAPAAAYDAALAAARAQGWRIGEDNKAGGAFEATTQSFWYGFIDDIAVRVRPDGEGSLVDVRSASRVGVGDMGANAKRIRQFSAALKARAGAG